MNAHPIVGDQARPASRERRARGLLGALLAGLVVITVLGLLTTLHELMHVATARLLGIPAVLLSPTSAGVSDQVAATFAPWRLAVAAGVAPLVSTALGLAAWALLLGARPMARAVRAPLTWIAIVGVPYLGAQLVISGSPVRAGGSAGDAAVVAGFLGLSRPMDALVVLVGLVWFPVSALLLAPALRVGPRESASWPRLSDVRLAATRWRRVAGGIAALAAAGFGLFGVASVAAGGGSPLPMLRAVILSGVAAALLTPWRHPVADRAWRTWVGPGLIGLGALFVFGTVANNDYAYFIYLVGSLLLMASLFATGGRAAAPQSPPGNGPSADGHSASVASKVC